MSTPKLSPALKLAVDLGPLLVFFGANALADRLKPLLGLDPGMKNIVVATGAFMAATAAALLLSWWKTGRVPPMLLLTGVVVAIFGGATLYFQDATWLKVKATLLYVSFAAILFLGLATRRPYLKFVLHDAFPALTDRGWAKLTRNWALFFLALAATNEVLRRILTDDQYVTFKVWGVLAATFVFMFTQAPLLTRHAADTE